jgi:hypothetical protein
MPLNMWEIKQIDGLANLAPMALYLMFEKRASQKEILKFLEKITHVERA